MLNLLARYDREKVAEMDAEDLRYLANVQHDSGLIADAIQTIRSLSAMKPAFNKEDRNVFGLIYKGAIDPVRQTVKTLNEALAIEQSGQATPLADKIEEYRTKSLRRLVELCTEAATTIEDTLMPHAIDDTSVVFFEKMRGDLYRYLSETEDAESTDKARKAYEHAMEVANKSLRPCDPVRLGTLLNYAVFLYGHDERCEAAIEMLKEARDEIQRNTEQMSEKTMKETLEVVNVIQSNLSNWCPEEEEEETE